VKVKVGPKYIEIHIETKFIVAISTIFEFSERRSLSVFARFPSHYLFGSRSVLSRVRMRATGHAP
jgi:hypothetical protein